MHNEKTKGYKEHMIQMVNEQKDTGSRTSKQQINEQDTETANRTREKDKYDERAKVNKNT